jgi:hypothetical protein
VSRNKTHPNANEPWTEIEDKLLQVTWGPEVDVKSLSVDLGRSREAVERRARILRLSRKIIAPPDPGLRL